MVTRRSRLNPDDLKRRARLIRRGRPTREQDRKRRFGWVADYQEIAEEEIQVQTQPSTRTRQAAPSRAELQRRATRPQRPVRIQRTTAQSLRRDQSRPAAWGGSRADKLAFAMREQNRGRGGNRVPKTINGVTTRTGLIVSSNIKDLDWVPTDGGTLFITFWGGKTWKYWPVKKTDYINIKNGAETARTGIYKDKFPSVGAAAYYKVIKLAKKGRIRSERIN